MTWLAITGLLMGLGFFACARANRAAREEQYVDVDCGGDCDAGDCGDDRGN